MMFWGQCTFTFIYEKCHSIGVFVYLCICIYDVLRAVHPCPHKKGHSISAAKGAKRCSQPCNMKSASPALTFWEVFKLVGEPDYKVHSWVQPGSHWCGQLCNMMPSLMHCLAVFFSLRVSWWLVDCPTQLTPVCFCICAISAVHTRFF